MKTQSFVACCRRSFGFPHRCSDLAGEKDPRPYELCHFVLLKALRLDSVVEARSCCRPADRSRQESSHKGSDQSRNDVDVPKHHRAKPVAKHRRPQPCANPADNPLAQEAVDPAKEAIADAPMNNSGCECAQD